MPVERIQVGQCRPELVDPDVIRQMNQLVATTLQDVCRTFDFKRSALFLYALTSGCLEGIHGYNIQVQDIQRIRETESNLPTLQQAFQIPRPMYLSEAAMVFPKEYVRRFHLTSLLIFPLRDRHKEPAAFLLLDQDGEPFTVEPRRVASVESALRALTQPVISHLYTVATNTSIRRVPAGALTRRERQTLQLIATGMETKDVAQSLGLSDYTVTEHIGSAMRKLQARNRTEAVATALRWHLID